VLDQAGDADPSGAQRRQVIALLSRIVLIV
jgi:hypothetical protein